MKYSISYLIAGVPCKSEAHEGPTFYDTAPHAGKNLKVNNADMARVADGESGIQAGVVRPGVQGGYTVE